jgi:putative ABC transport system permease protein
MDTTLPTIPLSSLLIAFAPSVLLLVIMRRWSLNAPGALYANARMLAQLLAVGYVLTYVFETDQPGLIVAVVGIMVVISAWIALRPLGAERLHLYPRVLAAITASGVSMLAIVTQLVLDLPRWFEPSFVVPLAGMIFANAMNTVSLAAERYESGVEPLVAVRYQIMVMCMVFGSGGLGAALYLVLRPSASARA